MANLVQGEWDWMRGLPFEYGPQVQDVSRQTKMADILRQQAQEMPQGQMVSGHYVAPSITQYMANALQGYKANQMQKEADAKQGKILGDWQNKQKAASDELIAALRGQPVEQQLDMVDAGGMPGVTQTVMQPPNQDQVYDAQARYYASMNMPEKAAELFAKRAEMNAPFSGTLKEGEQVFRNGQMVAENQKADNKKPIVVDGVVLDPVTMQPLYTAPQKPEKPTSDMQEYNFAKSQGYKGSFTDWQKELRKSGAASVSVGFPQETFKNEQGLRKEFQDLPTTKAFREVQTAYDQITTALKNPSAANDLAAATKFMKLLDPGSVVRESELAMAMEATGKLDQFMNYANRIKTGEKLTPSQRKDFANAANALYGAAAGRYNEAAGEFRGMAGDYKLNPDRIAKPATAPKEAPAISVPKVRKYNPATGKIE